MQKRYISNLLELANGMPEFTGEINQRGPFKFCKETTFTILPREEEDGNPNDLLFNLEICYPSKKGALEKFTVSFPDKLNLKKQIAVELFIPVAEIPGIYEAPLDMRNVVALFLNGNQEASLKIETDDNSSDITFIFKCKRFTTVAEIEISEMKTIEEFFIRRGAHLTSD